MKVKKCCSSITTFARNNLIAVTCIAISLIIMAFVGGYFAGRGAVKSHIIDSSSKKDSKVFTNSSWRSDGKCPVFSKPYCKSGKSTLILISLDGFRADYLLKKKTPSLSHLIKCGVHSPFMRSVYPTKTFPNHYSIITGLYTESHGITDNEMYSPSMNKTFKLGTPESKNPKWWGGEPLWLTAKNQGKISATYFWPGSDTKINDEYPNYYEIYNKQISFKSRVYKILTWLLAPISKRPDIITLYLSQPDGNGHKYGPSSKKMDEALELVDQTIDTLMQEIHNNDLQGCTNLMVVADHGMAESLLKNRILLEDIVKLDVSEYITRFGSIGQIRPLSSADPNAEQLIKDLTCKNRGMRVYKKGDTPVRFHYSNNERIAPVLLDLNEGYTVYYNKPTAIFSHGEHGYDNMDKSMRALFIAHGPLFKENEKIEPFQSIELYGMMCDILTLKPAPNNGTEGSLNHILKDPFSLPKLATQTFHDYNGKPSTKNTTNCDCDDLDKQNFVQYNKRLQLFASKDKIAEKQLLHDPFVAVPKRKNFKRLINEDYLTIFDAHLSMPVYVAFTLKKQIKYEDQKKTCWRTDVRVGAKSPDCLKYNTTYFKANNIIMGMLFDKKFSSTSASVSDTFVTTNSIPTRTNYSEVVVPFMNKHIMEKLKKYENVNVIHGPLFDYGVLDHKNNITVMKGKHNVASHFFYIITSCNKDMKNCNFDDLNTEAYILPHVEKPDNCLDVETWKNRNQARIRDVELLTGLTFFTKFPTAQSARIRVGLPKLYP